MTTFGEITHYIFLKRPFSPLIPSVKHVAHFDWFIFSHFVQFDIQPNEIQTMRDNNLFIIK